MNRVRENVLNSRKNGMGMMLLLILLHLLAVAGLAVGIVYESLALIILCILILSFGWILFCGLKVLKPQEALVLTLFGKYVGTLKEPGFYYVNPFCTAVNPAAQTKLKQSGDVDAKSAPIVIGSDYIYILKKLDESKDLSIPFDSVRDEIERTLRADAGAERFDAWIDSLRKATTIRVHKPTL